MVQQERPLTSAREYQTADERERLSRLIPTARTGEERLAAREKLAEFERAELARKVKVNRNSVVLQIGPRHAHASLDNFEVYHPKQSPVLAKCREIAAGMKAFIAEGRNLLLYGSVGAGKDHILAALLLRAAEVEPELEQSDVDNRAHFFFHGSIQMISGRDVFGQETPASYFKSRVLGISDPVNPSAQRAPWELAKLFDLADAQYKAKLCTWVTMNAQTLEIAKEQLSPPIFDRFTEDAVVLQCLWPSYRQRTKKAS
jgi:hypothetical protein